MDSIPLKQAISSNAYFKGVTEEGIEFRIKFFDLKKLDITQVDEPSSIDKEYDLSVGEFLLLKIELVSLFKETIRELRIIEDFLLIDQDGFKFEVRQDSHLCCFSQFSNKSDLNVFFGRDLTPKIKKIGTISFYVPKDENNDFIFAIKGGSLQEI